MRKTPSKCANGPRWLWASLLVIVVSSLLTGCLPPPPRHSAPPAPPHPGAWIQNHADKTA